MTGPPEGRLVMVCGLPGAGKTTLARQLEESDRGIRFCPDDRMADLGIDIYDSAARARIEELQWSFAKQFLQCGALVIIEWGTWGRDERDRLREEARALGAKVELRFLDAPLDVLWARIEARGMEASLGARPLTRADLESYDRSFQRPDAHELSLYDAS